MSVSPQASSSKLSSVTSFNDIDEDDQLDFSLHYSTHRVNPNGWSPETSPTSSEDSMSSNLDRSYSGDMEDEDEDGQIITTTSSSSKIKTSPSPTTHHRPQTRMTTTSILSSPSTSKPKLNKSVSFDASTPPPRVGLPKSQPLSRALFARMTEIPHAGTMGSKKSQGGASAKLLVATKPMRTTFELGLTASELARRG